jgi:hypothetical protein
MSDLSQSFAYVENAIASLPEQLTLALEARLPKRPSFRTVVTSGIGASEGPARILAALLSEAGLCARFSALSEFGTREACAGGLLVLFSQGLSPNARLTLEHAEHFDTRWLVTSVDEWAAPAKQQLLEQFTTRGFVPIVLPPTSEPGTLVRLIGPTVALLGALRIAAVLRDDDDLAERARAAPQAYRAIPAREPLPEHALAIVTVGVPTEWANAQRWKLLEALLRWDPPVWDVLQFAHGPLQAFHHQRLMLLVLERGDGSPLVPRLQATLNVALHRVIHLTSRHDNELACFEHAAAIDNLLLRTLRARPRNLFDWPARHGDGPLYGLGGPST